MIFSKNIKLLGVQTYALTQGDVIVIKVKGQDEFKYKVPDNWQGDVKIDVSGSLSEIIPS